MPRLKSHHVLEVFLFAAVGMCASVVHFVVGLVLIERFGVAAWLANIEAFCGALPVSYAGHSALTFSASRYGRARAMTWTSARRFLVTALGGFSMNQLSVVILVSWLGLPHRPVLFFTIFGVAAGLFIAGKFWVFRGHRNNRVRSPRG